MRVEWLNILRGICSLWIVYYHLYTPFAVGLGGRLPPLNANWLSNVVQRHQESGLSGWLSFVAAKHDVIATMSLHAVGIFILMSGFGLTASMLRMKPGNHSWSAWLGSKFLRLYPFLWFAHLIFLCAPFVWRPEPIDFRFLISLTGVRAWPMDMIFFYANPSWWFFWLVVQLYLVFPLLLWLLRKLSVPVFLAVTMSVCLLSRYWLLFHCSSGDVGYLLTGGVFLTRLGEFAMGMALARAAHESDGKVLSVFRLNAVTLGGAAIYIIGFFCYTSKAAYIFVDPVATLGLFIIAGRLSIWLQNIPLAARWFTFAGSVSLSTFLLHQPWTITAGLALHGQPEWMFAAATLGLVPLMVVLAWGSERIVRALEAAVRQGVERMQRRAAGAPA